MVSASERASRGHFEGHIVANRQLCREHFILTIALEQFPSTRPGQFVQISCHEARDAVPHVCEFQHWHALQLTDEDTIQRQALLRRPFSIASLRRGDDCAVEIDIIHRVVGVGTARLERLCIGESISIIGPLGNCFTIDQTRSFALLIGGGVGIPPMIFLAEALTNAGIQAVGFVGATTADLLSLSVSEDSPPLGEPVPSMCIGEFAQHRTPTVVTTDDGSLGVKGLVTSAVDRFLNETPRALEHIVLYTCGPEPMMIAVAGLAERYSLPAQVCMERAMACGMSTCQSCVCKIRNPAAPGGWGYQLVCTDGPVFDSRDIVWEG